MSKNQASTEISPARFGTGNGIYFEDLVTVVEMGHLIDHTVVASEIVNLACGHTTWPADSTTGAELSDAQFPELVATGRVTIFSFRVYIDPDLNGITAEFEVTIASGDVGTVYISIGGNQQSAAGLSASGESTLSWLTSNTGTGWQPVVVDLERTTAGAADQMYLERIRIKGNTIAAGAMIDPIDE